MFNMTNAQQSKPVDLGSYRREKAPLNVAPPTEGDECNCPGCSEESLYIIRPQHLRVKA